MILFTTAKYYLSQNKNVTLSGIDTLCLTSANRSEVLKKCHNHVDKQCFVHAINELSVNLASTLPCGSTNSTYHVNFEDIRHLSSKRSLESNHKIKLGAALIVKTDAYRVIEWIAWHYIMGVDFYLIFDDRSEDNLKDALEKFRNMSIVTYWSIDDPIVRHGYNGYYSHQLIAYNHALRHSKAIGIDWILFVDVDEFILPVRGNSVLETLNKYHKNVSVGAIQLGLYNLDPDPTFIVRRNHPILSNATLFEIYNNNSIHIHKSSKMLVKVSHTIKIPHVHFPQTNGSMHISASGDRIIEWSKRNGQVTDPDPNEPLLLLHFRSGSLEEFMQKRMSRARADFTEHDFYSSKRYPQRHCYLSFECVVSEWLCQTREGEIIRHSLPSSGRSNEKLLVSCPNNNNNITSLRVMNDDDLTSMAFSAKELSSAIASSVPSKNITNVVWDSTMTPKLVVDRYLLKSLRSILYP